MPTAILVGDSYTFGVGCSDRPPGITTTPSQYCWGALLEAESDYTVVNLAVPGFDNLSIVESLWNYIQSGAPIDIIMFNASYSTRFQGAHPDTPYVTLPVIPNWSYNQLSTPFNNAVEEYYRHLYNDHSAFNYTVSSILAAWACAQFVNAEFYWSNPSVNIPKGNDVLKHTDVLNRLASWRYTAMPDIKYLSDELAPDGGHPNNAGHVRYFNSVIRPLLIK